MADYEYQADLDIGDIRKKLQQAAKDFDKFAKEADRALARVEKGADQAAKGTRRAGEAGQRAGKQIADGAKISGVSLGITSGIVQELTGRFLQLAGAAVRSLVDISKEAVRLNASIETADRVFDAAFGDPNLGEEVLKFLDETAERFNINKDLARSFGQSILPKTDSVENFTELLRLTDIQADATGKSVGELEFAIREALSGDFVSLKDQFDIGNEQIQQIKDLTPTMGRAGALAKVLGEEFVKLGKVNIEGTLNTDIKAVQSEITDLQTVLGKPIFDELKEQVSDLGGVLDERGADFELMAAAIGDVVASAVDFIGSGLTDFLRDLDTEQVQTIANNFLEMIESGRTLAEVLGALELPGKLLDGLETVTQKLGEALTTATQIAGLAQAEGARQKASAVKAAELTGFGIPFDLGDPNSPLALNPAVASFFLDEAQNAEVAAAGQKAYNDELLKTVAALDESKKREEAVAEAQKKRREEQGKQKPANTQALNDILQQRAAEKEAARTAEELAAAQEKVAEAMANFETDKARAELDALIKAERAAADAAVDAARQREAIALKNQQAIEDIARKNEQALAEAATEAGRDEEDAARESGRTQADISRSLAQKTIDIARQAAQKKVDIETAYRRKIQEIAQRFSLAALDAERSRDAVAFLAARRERDLAFAGAATERDQGLADVDTDTGRQQQEAQAEAEAAREQERIRAEQAAEDRAVEAERRMEDLRAQLTRELEAQAQANERELEAQRVKEEQAAADRALALEREAADRATAEARKLEDLEKSLAEEKALVEKYEAQKTAAFKSESEKRIAQAKKEAQEMQKLQQQSASGAGRGGNPLTGGPVRGFPGRAAGGPVQAGQAYMVGEQGRELFTPNVPGYITPNNRLPSAVPAPAGASFSRTLIDNSQTNNLDLIDPTKLSAVQRAMLRNEVAAMMDQRERAGRRAGVR